MVFLVQARNLAWVSLYPLSNESDIVEVERRANLPTIKHKNLSKAGSNAVKRNSKHKIKPTDASPMIRGTLKSHSDGKSLLGKDSIAKRQRNKHDATSGSHKTKLQNELNKLKQTNALKYKPKLSVETPFMAKRIKFVDEYHENDPRWTHRITLREEYQRRDQVKQVDKYMKTLKIVYDQCENSPFYNDLDIDYIDERRLIPDDTSDAGNRYKSRAFRRNIMNNGLVKKDKIYTSLNPYYVLQGDKDTTLVFESRFESGNLRRVIQVDNTEYDWFLRNDYNSQGYTQWFYFSISNVKSDQKYTFNLKNFFKPDSLYNQGMKPLIYSTKKAESDGIGWFRGGEEIWYYQNSTKKKNGSGYMYSLTFTIEFPFDNDEVYLAHCFPYTYRDCKEHVDTVWNDNKKLGQVNMKDKVRKTELCKSVAGNSLDLIIITNFNSPELDIAEREAVIITGRVHPGETNASFIVEGLLDYLVGDTDTASQLRSKYVFKIIPMLNPDGVILGNYRCSLSGQDLNRQWINATSRAFPEIYATKLMFKKTLDSRKIFLFVDVHGHSRKKNVFMYGCKNTKNNTDKTMKVFPLIMAKAHPSFSYDDWNFNIQKDKESTGRVVVNRNFDVTNSFTLESSFFGPDIGAKKDCHFTPTQLRDVGRAFWVALNEAESEASKNLLSKLNDQLNPNNEKLVNLFDFKAE